MAFGAPPRRSLQSRFAPSGVPVPLPTLLSLAPGAGAQLLVLLSMVPLWNGVLLTPQALCSVLAAGLLLAWLPVTHWLRLTRTATVDGGIAPAAAEALASLAPLLGTLILACYWLGHCALAALALNFAVQGLQILSGSGLAGWIFPLLALLILALPWRQRPAPLRHGADLLCAALAAAILGWLVLHRVSLLPPGLSSGGQWLSRDPFSRVSAWCAGMVLAGPSLCACEAMLALPVGQARRGNLGRPLLLAALGSTLVVLAAALLVGTPGAVSSAPLRGQAFAQGALALAAGWLALRLSRAAALRALPALFHSLAAAHPGARAPASGDWLPVSLTSAAILAFWCLRDLPWLFAGAGLAYFLALTGVAAVALRPPLHSQHERPGRSGLLQRRRWPGGGAAALLAAGLWLGCSLLGLQAWGVQAVLVGLVMLYGGGLLHLRCGPRRARARASMQAALLAGMLLTLALNGLGYMMADQALRAGDPGIAAVVADLFAAVALLTVVVGVVWPAVIGHALARAAAAAERLTQGAVSGLRDGIDALGRGELEGVSVQVPSERLESPFGDDIGRIAASINSLQDDVQQAARGLDGARDKLRRSRAELFQQAHRDSLTGLHNRRAFEEALARLIDDRRQYGPGHALLYLDLDQFKIVNDTCGHDAGDELLRQVSLLLGAQMRSDDILSRLGGDEFGVILANCSRDNAVRIGEAMVVAVRELTFGWRDRVFRIGVSIGAVHFLPGTTSLTEVLSAADKACYFAKEQGRNRLHAYSPDDDEISTRSGEMQWVSRIHEAMEQGRMCLHAQAIHRVDAGAPGGSHHELLLRMVDAAGELVPPMAFIPAAERFGVMTLLDRWVVRTALERLRELARDGDVSSFASLAINLSGASITDETFLEYVKEQFRVSQVSHGRVWFEITETSAIANLRRAKRFISELRALGCRFGLDDFGAGMSSFGYLRQLDVDFLKIDGAFVQDMAEDPVDHAMVLAINRIGQLMGLSTIAEFVEDSRTIDMLRDMGVDMIQGNGVAPPVPFVQPPGRQVQAALATRDA